LRDTHRRIAGIVLINAVGILSNDPNEIVHPDTVTPEELGRLAPYSPDLAALSGRAETTDDEPAVMASDRIAATVYAGQPYMHDPRLRGCLHRITIPVLVCIVPLTYQCAYVDCVPNARLHLIANAGHMPHIEQLHSSAKPSHTSSMAWPSSSPSTDESTFSRVRAVVCGSVTSCSVRPVAHQRRDGPGPQPTRSPKCPE
jgi:hypothetical protein